MLLPLQRCCARKCLCPRTTNVAAPAPCRNSSGDHKHDNINDGTCPGPRHSLRKSADLRPYSAAASGHHVVYVKTSPGVKGRCKSAHCDARTHHYASCTSQTVGSKHFLVWLARTYECCECKFSLSMAPRVACRCRCGQFDHDDPAFSQQSQHLEVVDTKSGCKRLRVLA